MALAVTAGLVAGGGGIAFAYFTDSGSGTGSAQVAGPRTDVFTIAQIDNGEGPTGDMLPGGDPQEIDFSVTNNSDSGEYLGVVGLTVMTNTSTGDAETANGTDISNCLAS